MSSLHVELEWDWDWEDGSDWEPDEFRIYRAETDSDEVEDDVIDREEDQIATTDPQTREYDDYDIEGSTTYQYEITAWREEGGVDGLESESESLVVEIPALGIGKIRIGGDIHDITELNVRVNGELMDITTVKGRIDGSVTELL